MMFHRGKAWCVKFRNWLDNILCRSKWAACFEVLLRSCYLLVLGA